MNTMPKSTLTFLPYGRQHVTDDDIAAVAEVLRSDWLTQGPTIAEFERELADVVGARHVVACATGTAALHLTMLALGIGNGDVVVTSPNTFLADANCARYVGAEVQFADIDLATGNIDPDALAGVLKRDAGRCIKAIIPVHFAGQPVDLPRICELAKAHGAVVVDDACHALGATYDCCDKAHRVGSGVHAAMTVYSFHPVKHVAMGEGGAVATNDDALADTLRLYRNHGMTKENLKQSDMALSPDGEPNPWYYEMQALGMNYRLTDVQAALGKSQLKRLNWSVERRNQIAAYYREGLKQRFAPERVKSLDLRDGVLHAYHLFVLQIDFESFGVSRAAVMNRLGDAAIGTQVHYVPVPLQPYYRECGGFVPGDFPSAETYYEKALSIPMYPDLTDEDLDRVLDSLRDSLEGNA